MSRFEMTMLTCPACGTTTDFQVASSVNADRRPDLRDEILADTFQKVNCPSCGKGLRLEPMLNYLDVESGLWLAVYPSRQIARFLTLEDEAYALFVQSYGASDATRAIGGLLQPRVVFGWPGLREKLLLRQNKLDDLLVEMLKLDLMRRLPQAPMRPGVELRVVDLDERALVFAWIETTSETVLQQFQADRALLTEICNNMDGWTGIGERLTNGLFVDAQKLYLGEGRDAA